MRRLLALGAVLALTVGVTAAAKPSAPLEARVAALEAEVARLAAIVDEPAPTLAPSPVAEPAPTPTADPWVLVFDDNYQRTIAEGHFLDGGGEPDTALGILTADGLYRVYRSGWRDTSGNGRYDPSIISVGNGMLNIRLQTRDGFPRVAALTAQPPDSSVKGGILGMRYEIRIRADAMVGYKGVPMMWADAATTNDLLLEFGENDYPEADFDKQPKAYMHRTNATSFGDQDVYSTPSGYRWMDWHTYTAEWVPGEYVEFFADGVSIGRSTSRIPTTPMHMNMQFETWTNGVIPDPSVTGDVQVDRLRIWAYQP